MAGILPAWLVPAAVPPAAPAADVEPPHPDVGIVANADLIPGVTYKLFQKRQAGPLLRADFRRNYRYVRFVGHEGGRLVMTVFDANPVFGQNPHILERNIRYDVNPDPANPVYVIYNVIKDMGGVPLTGVQPPVAAVGGRRRGANKSRRRRRTYRKMNTRRHR